MSHDNFQPPEHDEPEKDDDDRMYGALSDLAGLDTHDVSLRDHPKAYEVLDRLMTHVYGDGRDDAAAEIARLQAQVDALAGALRDLLDAHARNTLFSGAGHWDVARAALAAAGR